MDDSSSWICLAIALAIAGTALATFSPYLQNHRQQLWSVAALLGVLLGLLSLVADRRSLRLSSAGSLIEPTWNAVALGAVSIPLWFFIATVLTFIYQHLVAPLLRTLRLAWQKLVAWRSAQTPRVRSEPSTRPDIHEDRQRERARLAAEEQARQKQIRRQRYEETLIECELCYANYRTDIEHRFSRADFDQFVAKHLREELPPEETTARGEQLRASILQHVEKVQPARRSRTVGELAQWFEDQQQQLESIPDERLRHNCQVRLKDRYAELLVTFMEELQS